MNRIEDDAAPMLASFVCLRNPHRDPAFRVSPVGERPLAFHARLPGYHETRLARLDDLAADLGVSRIWVKDESFRLGLPAFKVLGVSWAIYRALSDLLGSEPSEWTSLEELRDAFSSLAPLTVVAATDGNHGRAVARVARWFGLGARIFTPAQIPPDRAAAIGAEGAEVVMVDGTYDEAVETAAMAAANDSILLVSDTARSAEDIVPSWIVEGYSTMFMETDRQLLAMGEEQPDLVLIQIGVGSLAAAAARHYRREGGEGQAVLVGVEPSSAAGVLESARAGEKRVAPGPHTSAMDCLNAGAPSATALPILLPGFDAFIAVGDELVADSMQLLARAGIVSGATGVAGMVGLRAACRDLGLTETTRVLLINTEGVANPTGYATALRAGMAESGPPPTEPRRAAAGDGRPRPVSP